ncbi:MAG: hypothetical protein D6704_05180 [Nitrospirae bacterium]|nr:MAG: hypothetical protein D6704_05180 [Nitrospirota bacterium]
MLGIRIVFLTRSVPRNRMPFLGEEMKNKMLATQGFMKGNLITTIGSLLTIGLAVMFGIMGKPTEIGIIGVVSTLGLAFLTD